MKKTLRKQLKIAFVGVILTLIASCSKFESGGNTNKAKKNLTSVTWKLSTYFRNGVNETATIHVSNWTEHYMTDGVLHRDFIDQNGDTQQQTGAWELIDDNANVKIDGVGSIDLSPQTGTVSASQIQILKLTKDEFWYSFTNGSDAHEFHLVPN